MGRRRRRDAGKQRGRDPRPGRVRRRPARGAARQEFFLLQDTAAGKALAVTLFETEEDYRQGDETLNSMSPPGDGMGERVSVEKYELVVHLDA